MHVSLEQVCRVTYMSIEPQSDDLQTRRAVSVARYTASVTELLDHRADLHGVHKMADLVYDSVRWSA